MLPPPTCGGTIPKAVLVQKPATYSRRQRGLGCIKAHLQGTTHCSYTNGTVNLNHQQCRLPWVGGQANVTLVTWIRRNVVSPSVKAREMGKAQTLTKTCLKQTQLILTTVLVVYRALDSITQSFLFLFFFPQL